MSSRRPARLLLALILALGAQTAYVNPSVAAAELRAMACCAHHCDAPVSLPAVRACCQLTAAASGPAEAAAQGAGPLMLVPSTLPAAAVLPPPAAWTRPDQTRVAGSGPPTFLEQRHLLL